MEKKKGTTTFSAKLDDKIVSCDLRKPDFEQINLAMNLLTSADGSADMGGAGKILFDTCIILPKENTAESRMVDKIKADGNAMYSICLRIAGTYLKSIDVDVKKN